MKPEVGRLSLGSRRMIQQQRPVCLGEADVGAAHGPHPVRVQNVEMTRIEQRLQHLHPVGILHQVGVEAVRFGQIEPRIVGQGGLLLCGSEIHPDEAAGLAHRISPGLEAILEFRIHDIRRLEHLAVGVELPTMIDTAQPALFDTAEHQRRTPMRAVLVQKPDPAVGAPESHEALT